LKKILAVLVALMIGATGCASQGNIDDAEAAVPGNSQQTQPEEATVANLFEKGYYDYQGMISDSMKLQMSFYPKDNEILGSYFLEDKQNVIIIKGKANGSNIELLQYDEKGNQTGSFVGTMKTVDTIEGMWKASDSNNSYPFVLNLKSILPGTEYGKRYAVAVGEVSDQAVEDFAKEVQNLIKSDNKIVEIQNKEEFVKNYDKIFNPEYKKAMSEAFPKYMFANWQGVMFGEGYNMWINATAPGSEGLSLRIIAINN
jgi:hypothetical protein